MSIYSVDKLMTEARRLAAEYRKATGKPLAVTGEIANYDAARLLDLELVQPGETGYDALGKGARAGERIQIKGRAIFDGTRSGHRIGQLKLGQDWDTLLLVLMDENFEPYEIYEAGRETVEDCLVGTGNSRRGKRGAMSVAKFKNIGRLVWARQQRSQVAHPRDADSPV